MSHLSFPNESPEYREARDQLLAEEIALRRRVRPSLHGGVPSRPAGKYRRTICLSGWARISCRKKWKCRSCSAGTTH
jgi:hypothetical protein